MYQSIQELVTSFVKEPWRRPLYRSSPYKKYPQAERFVLPAPQQLTANYFELLKKRRSIRNFSSGPLPVAALSDWLYWSCGQIKSESQEKEKNIRRMYPSGGALYPLECYVLLNSVVGFRCGVYHYAILDHALEYLPHILTDNVSGIIDVKSVGMAEPVACVLLSFVEHRSHGKYGQFSNKLGLLEAGHVGQNFYLTGTALGISVCALGLGSRITALNTAMQFDGTDETLVYAIACGL